MSGLQSNSPVPSTSAGPNGSDSSRTSVGAIALAISNATVRLLSEYTGRGPTKARTYINDDLISIVLQDTLTKGERSLLADGEVALVLANRKAYQNTLGASLVAAVEELSGREVVAFLSDNHVEPDYAVESFVLAPRPAGATPTVNGKEESPNGVMPD